MKIINKKDTKTSRKKIYIFRKIDKILRALRIQNIAIKGP